eukprot:1233763-Heterocapsa_arctica.AAC.1
MRDDDAMLVDTVEKDEGVDAIVKGKGKGGKGKSKGKGDKNAARPTASSTPSTSSVQGGWWKRPCQYCGGRHMDMLCKQAPQ